MSQILAQQRQLNFVPTLQMEEQGGKEWDMCTWVQGFEGATVHAALVEVMRQSKPTDGRGEYEWCRDLADKAEKEPGLIASMLREALVDQVAAVLNVHLRALREQVLSLSIRCFSLPWSRRACAYRLPAVVNGGVAWRWRCSGQIPAGNRDGEGSERQVHAGTRPACLHQRTMRSRKLLTCFARATHSSRERHVA